MAMLTEAAVRYSLRAEVLAGTGPSTETVYEFWVPRSHERADMAIIGSSSIEGFEIKTERDTLRRLPRQIEAYMRLFDRCHVVLAQRHLEKALELLPEWWGVLAIDAERAAFVQVRVAEANAGVEAETLVRLLWRDEVLAALCDLGAPPDPTAGRSRMWQQLLDLVDLDGLKALVRAALLRRDPARARIPSQRFAVT